MIPHRPIIQFTLNMPDPSGTLPFSVSDKDAYTSQYSTWLSVGSANNIFKNNGDPITLYGEQAIRLKKLIDGGTVGGRYKVIDKIIEGSITPFYLNDDAACWAITSGPDNTVWGMDRVNDGLWKIDTKTETKTFYSVSNTTFIDICFGSDGNLWVANSGIGAGIVRVTPSGTATAFAINEDESSILSSITVGSDGNLWTSDNKGNVFKVNTDGDVLSTYNLVDPDTELALYSYYSCLGPDDNVWIVDGRGGVWKVETDGTATKYSNGNTFWKIKVGPDGHIWVTHLSSQAIWRITTSGIFTQYTTPKKINSLTAGPDGNLWGCSTNYYFKISTDDGDVTSYQVPGIIAQDICLGPDYNIWISGNDYIWRID